MFGRSFGRCRRRVRPQAPTESGVGVQYTRGEKTFCPALLCKARKTSFGFDSLRARRENPRLIFDCLSFFPDVSISSHSRASDARVDEPHLAVDEDPLWTPSRRPHLAVDDGLVAKGVEDAGPRVAEHVEAVDGLRDARVP
eukprot:1182532-Prorocentrum_minimum.AAC.2